MTILDKFSLKDQVAVVTGGVGLLGAEFCKTLAEAGAAVAVVDLNGDAANKVADGLIEDGYKAMAFLKQLPEGTRIYTNQPGPVYLYTGCPSYVLPDLVDAVTGLPREGYDKGVQALQKNVLSGDAVLALFKFSSEGEDVQSVYMQLSNGLYLAHNAQGDKIYTAFP